jgi:glycerol-3-phosphate dehydrogenase (NAD(P)+)
LREYKTSKQEKKIFVICSKGVEKNTFKLMSEVVSEIFPTSMISILSGPNFSSELIKQKPSACVLSSKNKSVLKEISGLVIQEKFRTYFNNDIIGTQIGGAMKNIIAIACGYITGCGLGENAKAAIITRGLSEIIDLGIKMGARRNTFYGLSGIGDLTLSCSSLKSRNAKFGYNLAKSKSHSNRRILLEGIESCESICALGEKLKVDLPISKSVKSIINGRNANKVICELLSRPLQFEK